MTSTPAYVIGADAAVQKASDDGEPGGTAGVPMLQMLLRRDMRYVVAIVTRYYGGVKLGDYAPQGPVLSRWINRGTGTCTVRAGPPSSSAISSRAAVRPNSTVSRDSADSQGLTMRHRTESSQATTDTSPGTEKPSSVAAATPATAITSLS
jgi:hypothetical protein